MTGRVVAAIAVAGTVVAATGRCTQVSAEGPDLAGRWALNLALSQFPREVGFGMDMLPPGGVSDEGGGGRNPGATGGGPSPAFVGRRESEDDARRLRLLVEEVRSPPLRLTIAQSAGSVTIVDERGRSRTLRTDGREQYLRVESVTVATTARWEAGRLVVRYKVEEGRELHYTYSRRTDPPQLEVQVRFVERGGRETVTRVYEPAPPDEPVSPDRVTPEDVARAPEKGPGTAPPAGEPAPPAGSDAASGGRAQAPGAVTRPDAELRGVTTLGVVVEELTPQAAACGLTQDTMEAAVSKVFADAGLEIARNSDEDTYVYVNVITGTASAGLCISRYDVTLYTHTMATLPYQDSPMLVQVSLLHKGGIAGGAPAAHADAVARSVKEYAEQFAARIRQANR